MFEFFLSNPSHPRNIIFCWIFSSHHSKSWIPCYKSTAQSIINLGSDAMNTQSFMRKWKVVMLKGCQELDNCTTHFWINILEIWVIVWAGGVWRVAGAGRGMGMVSIIESESEPDSVAAGWGCGGEYRGQNGVYDKFYFELLTSSFQTLISNINILPFIFNTFQFRLYQKWLSGINQMQSTVYIM